MAKKSQWEIDRAKRAENTKQLAVRLTDIENALTVLEQLQTTGKQFADILTTKQKGWISDARRMIRRVRNGEGRR